jgi:hypothetical protein
MYIRQRTRCRCSENHFLTGKFGYSGRTVLEIFGYYEGRRLVVLQCINAAKCGLQDYNR